MKKERDMMKNEHVISFGNEKWAQAIITPNAYFDIESAKERVRMAMLMQDIGIDISNFSNEEVQAIVNAFSEEEKKELFKVNQK